MVLLMLSGGTVLGQGSFPHIATVSNVMTLANNYWTNNNGVGQSTWDSSAYYTGNHRATRVLSQHPYYDWEVGWGTANAWSIGPEGSGNANAYCCGQTYIALYGMNSQPVYLASIKTNCDLLVASSNITGFSWIDAFFMQGPTLAQLGNLTGNTNYFNQLWQMYNYMMTTNNGGYGLYDPTASLWYRDTTFIYPAAMTADGGKVFWSRGNGWIFAGLAKVIQQMTTNSPHYTDYVTMFQTMAPAIQAVQGSDGMWRSSLYDSNQYPNPETSGTGFFTYGMAWGIRSKLLPAAGYSNTVILAWQGLTNLALQPGGLVGYVQAEGSAPASANQNETADYGVGAFLLACSEIYLLAPDAPAIRPWAGPDQTLVITNGTGPAPITLNASATESYSGSPVSYAWFDGTNQIATGVTASTNLAIGSHVITVKVLATDGLTYTDAMSVAVITNVVISNSAVNLKLRFNFADTGTNTTDSVSGIVLNLIGPASVGGPGGGSMGTPLDLHGTNGTGVGGVGKALNFTSASGQGSTGPLAYTAGNTNINLGTISNFTITLWVNPSSSLYVPDFPRFFSMGTNGDTDRDVANSFQLLSDGTDLSTTGVQGFVNLSQPSTSTFGAFNMPVNQWSFMALAYDGTLLNFYGGSYSNSVALMSSASLPAGNINLGNSWTVMIGNNISGSAGRQSRAFQGWIDDVRFYTGAASLNYLEGVRQALAPAIPTASVIGTGMSNGNLMVTFNGGVGVTYILQSATNLTPPVTWTPIATNVGAGNSITNLVPFSAGKPRQFLRFLAQ